jgi:hypothetical protein
MPGRRREIGTKIHSQSNHCFSSQYRKNTRAHCKAATRTSCEKPICGNWRSRDGPFPVPLSECNVPKPSNARAISHSYSRVSAATRFRLCVSSSQGTEATRSGCGSEAEDPAGFRQSRHHRRGLAYVSAHSGNDAGGDWGTSTHHPRLLAPQQSSCDKQVPAGNHQQQALGLGQACRCHFACRGAAGKEINPHPMRSASGLILVGDAGRKLIVP